MKLSTTTYASLKKINDENNKTKAAATTTEEPGGTQFMVNTTNELLETVISDDSVRETLKKALEAYFAGLDSSISAAKLKQVSAQSAGTIDLSTLPDTAIIYKGNLNKKDSAEFKDIKEEKLDVASHLVGLTNIKNFFKDVIFDQDPFFDTSLVDCYNNNTQLVCESLDYLPLGKNFHEKNDKLVEERSAYAENRLQAQILNVLDLSIEHMLSTNNIDCSSTLKTKEDIESLADKEPAIKAFIDVVTWLKKEDKLDKRLLNSFLSRHPIYTIINDFYTFTDKK